MKHVVYEQNEELKVISIPEKLPFGGPVNVQAIAAKSVPSDVEYVILDEIPGSEFYRPAWILNVEKTAIVLNEKKALPIIRRKAIESLRAWRKNAEARLEVRELKGDDLKEYIRLETKILSCPSRKQLEYYDKMLMQARRR